MNRQQMIERVLIQEAMASALRANAAKLRDELTADAVAEFAEQGTAPTWRLPDIGTVTLPVSVETVYVADEAAVLAWVKDRFPTEVETLEQIRPKFVARLFEMVRHDGESVFTADGEVVPGLAVKPGGQPRSLTFRPTATAREVLAAGAAALVEDVEKRLDGPVVLAEVPDAPA